MWLKYLARHGGQKHLIIQICFGHLLWQTEGVNLPSEARGHTFFVWMSTREPGSINDVCDTQMLFHEVCTAIRTAFLGCPPDWWSHGTFGVDELEDRVEDEPQDRVDFLGDAEFEIRD